MKILQLIDTLDTGGAERMAVNISNVLASEGYEVGLCVTRYGGSLLKSLNKKPYYFQLNKRNSFDLIAFINLFKLIKTNKFDVIHTHSTSIYWGLVIKLLRPSLKLIWHDHLGKRVHEKMANKLIIFISKYFDAVIVVNNELRIWAIDYLKLRQEQIFYINNFPVLEGFKLDKKNSNHIQVICLANIREPKNHSLLIEAINSLVYNLNVKNLKVLLVGKIYHDYYYKMILQKIEEYNLCDVIQFTGLVQNTAELLFNSDIGVLTSSSEGLPVALLEYGLAGLPVVCTNVGQCSEVLGGGTFGFVVDVDNVSRLSESIHKLIADLSLRCQLGMAFQNHIKVKYGELNFLESYKQILNSL